MRIEIERMFRGRPVRAEAVLLTGGSAALIYGGDRPHIGAVSTVESEESREAAEPEERREAAESEECCKTVEFESHRDGVISETWARKLAKLRAPSVAAAGIHYDGITREEIEELLELTNEMLEEVIKKLSAGGKIRI